MSDDNFKPKDSDLPNFAELGELANVSQEDYEEALKDWETDPPESEFKNLLNAEVVE